MQYRLATETCIGGFSIVNTEGPLLKVNSAYISQSGYTGEELLEMHIADLNALEMPKDVTASIEEIMRAGYAELESKHRRKDGRI